MLTGVCAVSSARMNDGWLSDEACRDGKSTGSPLALALLKGREKLNAGRGNLVPPIEISELIDGDLAIECTPGEIGEVDMPLPAESFRGDNTGTPLENPSSELSDIDLGLGVLCANGDRGGARARKS